MALGLDPPTLKALLMALPIITVGILSALYQRRGQRQLAARSHVPSDELAYLTARYRRRLWAGGIMILAGGLIATAYLSGWEARADAMGEPDPNAPRDANHQRVMTPDERAFFRTWTLFWASILTLAFILLGIAIRDAWATRRYWFKVYQELREDHQNKLRRDLAVYKAHKDQTRSGGLPGFGGRLGSGTDSE
ncbi:MAG: hypothetical protein ACRCZF_03530 [Gemmataceae bacterium]